jgi:hypothetical protein
MRRDGDVVEVQELEIGLRWFLFQHVKGRPAQVTALQRLRQRARVDEGATGVIDEEGASLHLGDGPSVKEVMGLCVEWGVKGHEIGLCQKGIQPPRLCAASADRFVVEMRIKR